MSDPRQDCSPTRDSGNTADTPEWWSRRVEAIAQYAAWAAGGPPPDWPLEIFLEVSNVCDLKCAMCPTFSGLNPGRLVSIKEQERGFLDISRLRDRLDELLKHALVVHCFGYGEPTLYGGFADMLDQLGEYRVMVDFFTNGMHLSRAFCELLVAKKVFGITVSFSGADSESYENVYLGGRFERVLGGLRQLHACKLANGSCYPRIEINSLAFDHHVKRLPDFVDLMADCGVEIIHLKALQVFESTKVLRDHRSVLRPSVEGAILAEAHKRAQARGLVLSCDQYERAAVHQESVGSQAREDGGTAIRIDQVPEQARRTVPIRPPLGYSTQDQADSMTLAGGELADALQLEALDGDEPFYCFEPFKTLYVRRSGNVKPCCFAADSGPALGTLARQDAVRIWRGAPWRTIRDGILAQRYPQKLCKECLRNEYGPRQHDVPGQLHRYGQWLQAAWGIDLEIELPAETLPNQEIVSRWRTSKRYAAWIQEVRRLTQHGVPRGMLQGNLDGLRGNELVGWLRAPKLPAQRLRVALFRNGEPWKCCVADRPRDDVRNAGCGDGNCGFAVPVGELPEGTSLEVRLADTDWRLGGIELPKKTTAASATTLDGHVAQPMRGTEPGMAAGKEPVEHGSSVPPTFEPLPFLLHYEPGIHEQETLRYFAQFVDQRPSPALPSAEQMATDVLVIAFTNRSGSNLLAEALGATGLVGQAGESFSYPELIDVCEREQIQDMAGYLQYLQRSRTESQSLAVKLSWDQLYFLTKVGVVPHYWPRARFALVVREDLLAQALSFLIAEKTQCWEQAYPSGALGDILEALRPRDLVAPLQTITHAYSRFWSYFAFYSITPVLVEYEDLAVDPEAEAQRVLTELDLVPADWQWRFDASRIRVKRQRTDSMMRRLEQLKNQLRLTLANDPMSEGCQ